ncbi:MAG: NAD-dependent malic enzyme [Actinomycetota bacterium]
MTARGLALLRDRYRNKGTAFSAEERDRFGLHGLLPPVVETIDTQLARTRLEYDTKRSDLGRHIFLRLLQARNSVLFYRFLTDHLEELLPIVYTPTVGAACQEWSRIYRREHGLYISWPDRHRVPELLDNAVGDHEIDIVVVTDGERILGLGDLGVGGMGIPIGKLALYTAAGGLDPARTLPVLLDVGTENESLLSDPLYLGWRSRRRRDEEYDELVDAFVAATSDRLPGALVQWEDFAQRNARRLLDRHRATVPSFNDDIQGTAAVSLAAIAAGMLATDRPFAELRLVVVGAGSAGTGVADQVVRALVDEGLDEAEAIARVWLVDRDGLVHDGQDIPLDAARRYARSLDEVVAVDPDGGDRAELVDVVTAVRPHVLLGVTGQPGLFTEAVVRAQAAGVDRPIVLPLSNPTPRAEAIPADVIAWTDGRAMVGTGSPFPSVLHRGRTHEIAQVNNVYVFPGIGLGVTAVGAREVTDGMLTAAARAVGGLSPAAVGDDAGPLLPPLDRCLDVSLEVALAVAERAIAEGVADRNVDPEAAIRACTWRPEYRPAT